MKLSISAAYTFSVHTYAKHRSATADWKKKNKNNSLWHFDCSGYLFFLIWTLSCAQNFRQNSRNENRESIYSRELRTDDGILRNERHSGMHSYDSYKHRDCTMFFHSKFHRHEHRTWIRRFEILVNTCTAFVIVIRSSSSSRASCSMNYVITVKVVVLAIKIK